MNLTEPLTNGNIHFTHRLVVPPMATWSASNGQPSQHTIKHYTQFAANPLVGLIITEYAYIDVQGKSGERQLSFASDDVITAQKALTTAVHETNPQVKIFAQINHAGLNTSEDATGQELVSASALQTGNSVSRALTIAEIQTIEQEFAAAALRVKQAGYDGVEIHAAHAYLLNQFYSPLTNLRTDRYGAQNIENRMRFIVETIRMVRQAVGKDFPIAVRFGGSDYMPGGSTIADAVQGAMLLQKAGIDLLDISGGLNIYMRRDNHTPGWFSDMSSAIKEKVNLPIILTGGITTREQADVLLRTEKADLIGVGRAMFRNPAWGNEREGLLKRFLHK